jgi:thermolysin
MTNLEIAINKIRKKDPKISISLNQEQTAITLMRGKISDPVDITALKKAPHKMARAFIKENNMLFGGIDEARELNDERVLANKRGTTHVVFQQKYGDAVVLGGNLSVHYGTDGAIYLIKSSLASSIDALKKANISADRATEIGKEHAGKGAERFEKFKPLLIVADGNTLNQEENEQRFYLCWQLELHTPKDEESPGWTYFIDAIRGEVLLRYPSIRTGSGTGGYSSSHDPGLNSEASGATFRLRDTVTTSGWTGTQPVVHTFDDNGATSPELTDYSEDPDDNWNNGGVIPANRKDDQRPEVDIHRYLGYILDYYFLSHGYNGWDGAGHDIHCHAHNELYPDNAYWWGNYEAIYFADGNGNTRDFMCPLDTSTHEFTHGVKFYFNILQIYNGESGALDEATSDLFGAFMALYYPADDPFPWHHANLYRLDGTNGRNMADPSRDTTGVVQYDATSEETKYASTINGYYPDHYSIRYQGPKDYHGVHVNAPIITHAVYLMINGGTHRLSNVTVPGIGVGPVEQMLFEIISTGLLWNNSTFADFRLAFIQTCMTLYPDNLDYLAAVKTAFHAVGIGPDLYIRDTLADQGTEPGVLSCMSPDIILRQQVADAATLALIGDLNNASLCQSIELGPDDHYVYFRLFNRGSVPESGTFRLFIAHVSPFPTPDSWHEVGHYDFPEIPANGGVWVPAAADQCITLSSALINALGVGNYCFIGIIESPSDPAPDRMLISDVWSFHAYISKSNNYVWRNCNIYDLIPTPEGDLPVTEDTFRMNGFDRRNLEKHLETDTRDLPEGTKIIVWLPVTKYPGLRATEARPAREGITLRKIAGAVERVPDAEILTRPVPLGNLVIRQGGKETLRGIKEKELLKLRPMVIPAGRIIRLAGLALSPDEKIDVRFTVKFPRNTGVRDMTLAFRELTRGGLSAR